MTETLALSIAFAACFALPLLALAIAWAIETLWPFTYRPIESSSWIAADWKRKR